MNFLELPTTTPTMAKGRKMLMTDAMMVVPAEAVLALLQRSFSHM